MSRRGFTAGLGASALTLSAPLLPHVPKAGGFKVYGSLLHAGEPDLRPDGINPIYLFDRGIWAEGISRHGAPDAGLIAQRLAKLPDDGAPIVMDFEYFKFRTREEAEASRQSLEIIAETFRLASAGRPIGFYGYLPRREFWRAIEGTHTNRYKAWQKQNAFLAPLESSVDMLFPSIYTFHDDPKKWRTYAIAQVREARQLSDKPVIPFIWPDFHYNGEDGPLAPIPAYFWRLQLETLAEIADGLVIWGGWDPVKRRRVAWDDEAPWWLETQDFMRHIGQR
jgi:hypothetical protein